MAKHFTLRSDGASQGNPGQAAIGAVLEDESGRVHVRISRRIGVTTNNRAEYLALIAGLKEALRLGAETLDIKLDSQLIVRQLNGRYQSRDLKALHKEATQLLRKFRSCTIEHVPRDENKLADALAKRALRRATIDT